MAGVNSKTFRLFEHRMHNEGKFDDYVNEIRRLQRDDKMVYAQARLMAMKNFGYIDVATERAPHEMWERMVAMGKIALKEQESSAVLEGRQREVDEETAYRQAFNALPETTAGATALDWIRAHEAMTRKARNPELEFVQILASDIVKAPSKSAVNALQNWANNPGKFFEKLRDGVRKAPIEAADAPNAANADDEVREAEEMLRNI